MSAAASSDAPGNGWTGIAPVLLCAALFVWFLSLAPQIAAGEVLRLSVPWVPSLGLDLAFMLDGLSLTFALMITGIGIVVMLHAHNYLRGDRHFGRFALFMMSFMLSMLGLVLADDLILLFVFWELTTVTSYLLIGYGHDSAKSRRSALQALFVTGAGGLAFLAGAILIGTATGSTSISELLAGDGLTDHALYAPILILVLAGAFTKSAQYPFHFWLPNAMAAPTPVSAFLHSATMVKAGVYLLARLHPSLSGTDAWFWALTVAGAITAVLASLLALRQTDLKQVLAYTTLMALGTLTLLLGQSSGYAITAFATFLIVHSLYKAALFLLVANIDHGTGTRDATILGGLGRAMPFTALAAMLSALSMAGLPPFLGFIGKELMYAGVENAPTWPEFIGAALVLANALMVAVAAIVAFKPFWRPAGGPLPAKPHEAPWGMWAGPLMLALLATALGLFPGVLQSVVVTPTVESLLQDPAEAKELKLWAGVNLPLVLSGVTVGLGLVFYLAHRPLRRLLARIDDATFSLDGNWDRFLGGLIGLATWQTRILQNGRLKTYMTVTFVTLLAAMVAPMIARGVWEIPTFLDTPNWVEVAVVALILAGTALVVVTSSRIAAIAGLGVVGVGVALVFIINGAPDVAITQLLVETLVVVLVAVAMLRLPFLTRERRPASDALLALGVGGAVTLTLFAVLAAPIDRRLTDYFELASYTEAYGRNIVNVILVDFRALDTFGEIAVVAVAALSAVALLRGVRGGGK
jgi:multicomponent Na+:H+ antiporter subunit A